MPAFYRILYLYPGPTPPPIKQEWDKHWHLSRIAEGDILLPVWWKNATEQQKAFPDDKRRVGNFRYHVYRFFGPPQFMRGLVQFLFYISNGLKLCRKQKYDFIICYGTNVPGLAALILKFVTGSKLIVEVSGVPDKAHLYDHAGLRTRGSFTRAISDFVLRACVRRAERVRLLFPAQLDAYPDLKQIPRSVFHEFVPVHELEPSNVDEKYLLLIGHPWYLKGADLLLKAYRELKPKFGTYRLKIVGWCTDRSPYEKLAEGLDGVEFSPGVSYFESLELMRKCSVFVLPSRTEAMGRVLLEAMALGKPLVASRVDGIPHIISDNENGLLFRSEDAKDLAEKIEHVLSDQTAAARLVANGLQVVRHKLDEQSFVSAYEHMLLEASSGTEQIKAGTAR